MKIKEIKATGKFVVCKVEEVKSTVETVTESGIILQTENTDGQKVNSKAGNGEKISGVFIINSIGPDVELSKYGFAIGDEVVLNDYDCQTIGDQDSTYVLCKADSVKAVVKAE